VTLVEAAPAHAAAMAAIHASAFQPPEAWGPDAFALQLEAPGAFGLICEAGGLILARVAGGEAEVLTLAVHPSARRRGAARALLQAAMRRAAAAGAERMLLEVASDNAAALGLYAAEGFRQVGLRPRYYASGADALILRAELPPCAAAPTPSRPSSC
jgi:ribosomal-protein-alanine N-acetyltransferase